MCDRWRLLTADYCKRISFYLTKYKYSNIFRENNVQDRSTSRIWFIVRITLFECYEYPYTYRRPLYAKSMSVESFIFWVKVWSECLFWYWLCINIVSIRIILYYCIRTILYSKLSERICSRKKLGDVLSESEINENSNNEN